VSMSSDQRHSSALNGTAILCAVEKRDLTESIDELWEMATGAEAAGLWLARDMHMRPSGLAMS
jgi:hypothetical protein